MVKTFKNYFSRWTLNSQKFRCVWWNPTPHTAHLPQHCRLGDSGRSFVLCLFIWSEIENVYIMIGLLSIWHPIGDKTTITTRQQFSLRENIKIGLYARWNSNCSGGNPRNEWIPKTYYRWSHLSETLCAATLPAWLGETSTRRLCPMLTSSPMDTYFLPQK